MDSVAGVSMRESINKLTVGSFEDAQVVREKAKPGDLLEYKRNGYNHWGVFEGKREDDHAYVIHFSGEPGNMANSSIQIQREKFETVVGNSRVRVNNGYDWKKEPFKSEQIIERAKSRLGETGYSLISNNCEHFAHWCRYDRPVSWQVRDRLMDRVAYGMEHDTRDAERRYRDNVAPSVRDAERCVYDVKSVIYSARELVYQHETKFAKDYKKVPDEICDSIMFECDQALETLDTSRRRISSQAVESLKKLSHGLTRDEQYEFSRALHNLERAERKLQELCKEMKYNVEQRSSFNELRWLIDNINEAIKTLRDRVHEIIAKRERITELMPELNNQRALGQSDENPSTSRF